MEILDSLEVRWFFAREDSAIGTLKKCFASIPSEGDRTDHYLFTGRNDLSFKARLAAGKPAKVETKYLVGSLGAVDVAAQTTGELQRWTKLSLVATDAELTQHGSWLAVKKARQLRKFAVDLTTSATVKEVAADAFVPIGCGVELTRLDYDLAGTPRIEWTFGFEAFGSATQLLDVLRATVDAVAAQAALTPLRSALSCSYATWLLTLPINVSRATT